MIILLDIGNTRLKWAVVEHNQLFQFKAALDYRAKGFMASFVQVWKKINTPKKIAISSVGSAKLIEELQQLIKDLWGDVDLIFAKSSGYCAGVSNAYRQPEKLGVDRWMALLAAHQQFTEDVCVVDCGTAVTIDFMTAGGQHSGGVISPGLALMKKSLLHDTAELPLITHEFVTGPADFTEAAIYSGTLFSVSGLIEYMLRQQKFSGQLVLTGGDAGVINEAIHYDAIIEPHLVLKGLAVYCGAIK